MSRSQLVQYTAYHFLDQIEQLFQFSEAWGNTGSCTYSSSLWPLSSIGPVNLTTATYNSWGMATWGQMHVKLCKIKIGGVWYSFNSLDVSNALTDDVWIGESFPVCVDHVQAWKEENSWRTQFLMKQNALEPLFVGPWWSARWSWIILAGKWIFAQPPGGCSPSRETHATTGPLWISVLRSYTCFIILISKTGETFWFWPRIFHPTWWTWQSRWKRPPNQTSQHIITFPGFGQCHWADSNFQSTSHSTPRRTGHEGRMERHGPTARGSFGSPGPVQPTPHASCWETEPQCAP